MTQPDKTIELYGGKVKIDYYDRTHRYCLHGTGDRLLSVTAATGMIDKSRPLILWAIRLSREYLLTKVFKQDKSFRIKVTEDNLLQLIDESHRQYEMVKEEAATTGTKVHKWAEEFIKGMDPEMPKEERVLNGVMAFLKFIKEHDAKFVKSEQIVYSKKHGFVGTMDCVVTLTYDGKRRTCVGDFKTNNWAVDKKTGERHSRVYDEMRYQTAAYMGAYEEEHREIFTGSRFIFCFDKDTGDFAVHKLDQSREDFEKDYQCFLAALTLKRRAKELSKWED